MQLLIGCGSNRIKKLWRGDSNQWDRLVTLDIEPRHKPDVVHDLNETLPFADNSADEIHAYDVLEHLGTQGDWRFFFRQFSDFWRVLKPNGHFFALVPAVESVWAWGDPGHTRIIHPACVTFLHQQAYAEVGTGPMTDYRDHYRADFDIVSTEKYEDVQTIVLKAIKPARLG